MSSSSSAQEGILFEGNELGVGTRAMGMGGAYIGVSDDYSALYWNPAGLGQLRRTEINIGFSHNLFSNNATYLNNENTEQTSFSRLNSLGLVLPVPTYQGSIVFAIGYNKFKDYNSSLVASAFNPKQSVFNWDHAFYDEDFIEQYYNTTINDSLYQTQNILIDGGLNQWSIGGSIEVQKDFYLGASLNFISGKRDYNYKFEEEDVNNIYNLYNPEDNLSNDLDLYRYEFNTYSKITATNFKLASFYRMGSLVRIGATITLPTTFTFKEDWDDAETVYFDTVTDLWPKFVGSDEYKIEQPYSFAAGASVKFLNFMFSGDLEYQDWSQTKFKTDPPVDYLSKADINRYIREDLKDVTKIRLGAEMFIPLLNARARAGFYRLPSPYKIAENDIDRNYVSAGASFLLDKQVMVDFGWVRGAWKDKSWIEELSQEIINQELAYNKFVGTLSLRF